MPRILGVDHGDRRTGLALSDPLGIIARPLLEVKADTPEDMVARIAAAAREHQAGCVVVGFPRNMDGSEGARAQAVKAFAAALRREVDPVPVELIDERLTTWEATRLLAKKKKSRRGDRKTALNLLAAQLILQSYLDGSRAQGRREEGT